MSEKIEFRIEDGEDGKRLDALLSKLLQDISRERIQDWIQQGCVTVNGKTAKKPSYKGKVDDHIIIEPPAVKPLDLMPENIPLDIVYEDDHLIVINKPVGMVVHPSAGHGTGTLVHALLHHCGDSLSGIGDVQRPGIVHRLDKDTSGLMVVAKSDQAHLGLSEQFSSNAKTLKRTYHAVVYGLPSPMEGFYEGNIGRDPYNRQKMAVLDQNGKYAKTHYKVEKVWGNTTSKLSLLSLVLETGRTHQIRVHLCHHHHPLVGDALYSKRRKTSFHQQFYKPFPEFSRQALHAKELSFLHPISKDPMHLTSDYPEDMKTLLDNL